MLFEVSRHAAADAGAHDGGALAGAHAPALVQKARWRSRSDAEADAGADAEADAGAKTCPEPQPDDAADVRPDRANSGADVRPDGVGPDTRRPRGTPTNMPSPVPKVPDGASRRAGPDTRADEPTVGGADGDADAAADVHAATPRPCRRRPPDDEGAHAGAHAGADELPVRRVLRRPVAASATSRSATTASSTAACPRSTRRRSTTTSPAAGATLKDGFNWDDYLTAREHFSKISTKQAAASSFAAKNDYAPLGPGAAGRNGVIANTNIRGLGRDAGRGSNRPNKYGYNITDMDKRCIYRMESEPSAAPTPKPSIPPGAPAPTPAPTVTQAVVEVSAAVVLTGIDPTDFNSDPQTVEAFAQTILATLPAALAGSEITDIRAKSARAGGDSRRAAPRVEYTIAVRQDAAAMTDGGASILSDVKSSLSAAVSSGEFLQTLIEEAAAAGGSAAMAFMTIDVDVAASTAAIGDATLTLVVTTPRPTAELPGLSRRIWLHVDIRLLPPRWHDAAARHNGPQVYVAAGLERMSGGERCDEDPYRLRRTSTTVMRKCWLHGAPPSTGVGGRVANAG